MLAKILFWWGVGVLGGLMAAVATAALIDTYEKGGAGALAIGLILLSSFPALFIGMVWKD